MDRTEFMACSTPNSKQTDPKNIVMTFESLVKARYLVCNKLFMSTGRRWREGWAAQGYSRKKEMRSKKKRIENKAVISPPPPPPQHGKEN